jgi:hypothetical protein
MKKSFLLILSLFCILISVKDIYAQLANSNMRLITNRNDHFTSPLYSAVWGYIYEQ